MRSYSRRYYSGIEDLKKMSMRAFLEEISEAYEEAKEESNRLKKQAQANRFKKSRKR